MFSLKSLCKNPGAPSGTRWLSSQAPTSLCRASVPASIAASPRLRQPDDAARQEPIRPAQVVQPNRLGIDRMDRRNRLQQHLRQPRADLRPMRQFGRQVLADHQARAGIR